MQVILIYYSQIFHLKHILIAYHAHASHYPFLHDLPHFFTCHSSPQLHYPNIITIAKSKMSRCSSDGGDKFIKNVRKTFQKLTFWIWRKTQKGKFKNIRSSDFVVGRRMELTHHCECGINGVDIWTLVITVHYIVTPTVLPSAFSFSQLTWSSTQLVIP
jgi:hypothetical protein